MRTLPQPRLGQVWTVDFDPIRGHEQGGVRPALVISNDQFNTTPHTFCIVVPFTRTFRGIPSHIRVDPPVGGLTARSYLLCEQAKLISVTRVRRMMGSIDAALIDHVQEMVGRFIDR